MVAKSGMREDSRLSVISIRGRFSHISRRPYLFYQKTLAAQKLIPKFTRQVWVFTFRIRIQIHRKLIELIYSHPTSLYFSFSSISFASHSATTFVSCICCSSRCFFFAAIFLLLHHLRSQQPRAGRLSSHMHYALMHSVLRNLFARSSLSLSTLFWFSHRIDCFSLSSWNGIMRFHIENWKTITDSNCILYMYCSTWTT